MATATPGGPGLSGAATELARFAVRQAVQVPIAAVSLGLHLLRDLDRLRREVRRRGAEAVELAANTPLGRLLPPPHVDLDDEADAEAARIVADARRTVTRTVEEAKQETREETPLAPAMPASTVADVVTERLSVEPPHGHGDLPIPDFDGITLGSLRARLRGLTLEQLVVLREWEQAHGHRLSVMTLLDNRIARLAADEPADEPAEEFTEESAGQSAGGTAGEPSVDTPAYPGDSATWTSEPPARTPPRQI